ncbi:hypothetical protein D3C87_81600 [compost metagenome]
MDKYILITGTVVLEDTQVELTILKGGKKQRKITSKTVVDQIKYARIVDKNGFLELFSSNNEVVAKFSTLPDALEAIRMIKNVDSNVKTFSQLRDFMEFKRETDERKQKLITVTTIDQTKEEEQ